jgi:hypothetical protein
VTRSKSGFAWETWNVITTMLELVLQKLEKNPIDRSIETRPIIRTWEVRKKGGHKRGIVYHVFDQLNKMGITQPVEPDIPPWEVYFNIDGIEKLVRLKDGLSINNRLQRVRMQVIDELLNEIKRNLFRSVPEKTHI